VIAKKAEEEEKRLRYLRVSRALAQASFPEYNSLTVVQRGVMDVCGNFGELLRSGVAGFPLTDTAIQQAVTSLVGVLSLF
jgi:hypothetical protein